MAADVSELEASAGFAREKLKTEFGVSLEECLLEWRTQQGKSDATNGGESLYERMHRAGLIGCIKDGSPDRSTNPKYMEGFGES